MAETPNTGVLMALEKQSAREFGTDLSTVHVFSGINCGIDVLEKTQIKYRPDYLHIQKKGGMLGCLKIRKYIESILCYSIIFL